MKETVGGVALMLLLCGVVWQINLTSTDRKLTHIWPRECVDYGIKNNVHTYWDGEICVIDTSKDMRGRVVVSQ